MYDVYAHTNTLYSMVVSFKRPQASTVTSNKPQENGLEFNVGIEGIQGPVCRIVLVHVHMYP